MKRPWLCGRKALHLIFIQCYTTRNDVAGISKKLRSCGLSNRQYSFQRFCSPCAVYIKLPINWKRASRALSCQQSVWSYVGSTSIGVAARENNRRAKLKLLVRLYRWSQQFDSGLQNKTITSLRSLFLPLLMTTVLLGSVSMPLSAFGSPDSIIPLCIGIFLNVQLVIESPSFARLTASHRPTSNAFSFDYIVVLPH